MRRRIIRKNKKRRDPRYFLHEDLGTPGDEPITNPAPLKTAQKQSADSAQQQAAHQDDKPETVTVANLTGDQEKKGAHLMLTFVNNLIKKMRTFTVEQLRQELTTAGYAPEAEDEGTQTAEAPPETGGLV
jgi:hypothetical protein